MRIQPIINQSFNGRGAGKIKALYMQNPANQAQVNIYNQMRQIGQNEGFDVFMNYGFELSTHEIENPHPIGRPWGVWSQDNKIIISKDNKPTIVTCEAFPDDEKIEAEILAHLKKCKTRETELVYDGGNIFLGKKNDGKNYFIAGEQVLYLSSMYLYLKSKDIDDLDYEKAYKFFKEGFLRDEWGYTLASQEEYFLNCEHWDNLALQTISKDFDTSVDDITILPSPEFHLDIAIRPLNYPYILINDDEEVDKTIAKLEKKFKGDFLAQIQINQLKENIETQRKEYHPSDEIYQILATKGFVPVKISGAYGRGKANFMNAIVHQKGDKLTYITNSTKPGTKVYEELENEFKKSLKRKCRQIKNIYFVSGKPIGKDLNEIMNYLGEYKGGIHCLCCEEMDE